MPIYLPMVTTIVTWTFLVIAVPLISGIVYEFVSRWFLERHLRKGKTFVNISGRDLHYVKRGKGNCTVVFQSGLGSNHAIWEAVQNSLEHDAVTISYDRNGLFLSDDSHSPVTNEAITAELKELLEKTGCPKPYIIVGHSMAGIYLRPFIEQHKHDILGIVFVEAAHPQQMKLASPQLLKTISAPPHWLIKLIVNTGIYRVLFSFIPLSPEIDVRHPIHQIEKRFFYRSYNKLLQEIDSGDVNFADGSRYTSFGALPLVIIMGTSDIRYKRIRKAAVRDEFRGLINLVQIDLLKLSTNSKLVEASNSGHVVQINDHDIIANEIRLLINK